ncbi:unnamed protein product [Sphenostylis stenocarpa]|uniref:Uncharacterized protein n=1 Tax=Sphenostylis stenocarpa TaxID=92480 RepID=A0AA86VP52_9FABA|nr:unnamed protein product [Sphenostylis stenocarpa]
MRSFPLPPTKLNPPNINTLAPTIVTTRSATPPSPTSPIPSPWHSPIPYLFGGLAIIMALISMALFILACSYWRLTRQTQQMDLENITHNNNNNNNIIKEGDDDPQKKEQPLVYEEKVLVIMAGDHKPTFLATPSTNTNFHKHLENSENLDMPHMETSDNNHGVVQDENGSSQEHNEQHSD